MPTLRRIGISTGTRMLIEAIGSRKQPTTSSSALISNRMMYLLSVRFSSASAPASVSRVVVSTHPNSEAAATIKSTPAVGSVVSIENLLNSFYDKGHDKGKARDNIQGPDATAAFL